jgi:cytidine deaminase
MSSVTDAMLESLVERARTASQAAYCPYSCFPVGAALLAGDGAIYDGCNVENASYGLTVCAERSAVFQMVARGANRIVALALFTETAEPSVPCGACLQVIGEFGSDALIITACSGAARRRTTLAELLPHSFRLRSA